MMPGQAPAAPEAAPAQEAPKKNPKDLVVGINSDLMQLVDMLSSNPATKAEAQEGAQIVQAYQSLVEKLGQAPGQQAPEEAGPKGPAPVSPEAGANPNARPM
jgi:hypothetical protein